MRITALKIDGFGVWSDLEIGGLAEGLNVFFGPNEAGKTTLMQFVRSILYGFSPQRQRYLPPVHGGEPGGSLRLVGPDGSLEVARHVSPSDPGGPQRVAVTHADGSRQGEHLLGVLLGNVDETVFNNVFCLGLRDLQELGVLDDTEAAAMLYHLSTGLGSVSLAEVLAGLEQARNHLLHPQDRPSEISRLLDQRNRLRADLEELSRLSRDYGRLAAGQAQIDRDVAGLQEQTDRLRRELRSTEIAASIRDPWRQRAEWEAQLAACQPADAIPPGAARRLEAIDARLVHRRRQAARWKELWQQLQEEYRGLHVDPALDRLAPRIEALKEQENWIDTLHARTAELESEIQQLEAQQTDQRRQFGLDATSSQPAPALTAQTMRGLRGPARALRQHRRQVEQAQQDLQAAEQTTLNLAAEVESALAAHGEHDLAAALDRQGALVAQLRRWVQLDQRLDEMQGHQADLEQQSCRLIDRQVLPIWVLVALGGVFVCGVLLVLVGLFFSGSSTSAGWLLALLGGAGSATALVGKLLLERGNAQRLRACQKQLGMLQTQMEEARNQREHLDRQLPSGEGTVGQRLQTAERRLAALEEIVPADSNRQSTGQEADAAGRRLEEARRALVASKQRWQQALRGSGLPPELSPKQVRSLFARSDSISEVRRRLELRYEEFQQRNREWEALEGRIAALAEEAGLEEVSDQPVEVVRELARRVAEQQGRLRQRQTIRDRAGQLRQKRKRLKKSLRRLKQHRRRLFQSVGVRSEEEFRQLAARQSQAVQLREKKAALDRQIEAALGGLCSEDEVCACLDNESAESLQARAHTLRHQLDESDRRLKDRCEQRGRLAEQIRVLSDDRGPALKKLELGMVEKRLQDALHRWQVRGVAYRLLEQVRRDYQRRRQPETLQQASAYLQRLTEGRYTRVWTPLDENILRVDTAEGDSLPVEVLSRGTREQLFICLRLALAGAFAKRGAALPLVLDDVLVNFDAARARATAGALCDFAAAGHQVLLFTCHAHIQKMFKSMRIPVNQLPSRERPGASLAVDSRKPRRQKAPPRPEPSQPEPEIEEIPAAPAGRRETVEENVDLDREIPVAAGQSQEDLDEANRAGEELIESQYEDDEYEDEMEDGEMEDEEPEDAFDDESEDEEEAEDEEEVAAEAEDDRAWYDEEEDDESEEDADMLEDESDDCGENDLLETDEEIVGAEADPRHQPEAADEQDRRWLLDDWDDHYVDEYRLQEPRPGQDAPAENRPDTTSDRDAHEEEPEDEEDYEADDLDGFDDPAEAA